MGAINQSTCKGCGADVYFVRNAAGNTEIIDATPVTNGRILIRDGLAVRVTMFDQPAAHEPTFTSHFATCPKRDDFRSVKRKRDRNR